MYFVEVVMKEGGGGDHVSVGVKTPRSRSIRPVSRKDLYVRPGSKAFSQVLNYIKEGYLFHNIVNRVDGLETRYIQ